MNHHPCFHAAQRPEHPALIIDDSGEVLSYIELEQRANQGAHLLRAAGLKAGDHVCLMLENGAHFAVVMWAILRSGLILTPISSHLKRDEIQYILADSDAKAFITSKLFEAAMFPPASLPARAYMCNGVAEAYQSWEDASAAHPTTPIEDEEEGGMMLYSSGTTGRPKGVELPWSRGALGQVMSAALMLEGLFGMDADTVYYGPAPLYHSGPLYFMQGLHRLGATVVIAKKFDAERALASIERYCVSHSQWVPTMLLRMLKLPQEARMRHDLSSLKMVLHGAAPCPIETKRQLFEWLGPIIHEHYSATEGIGQTYIGPEEWLARPGSVGRPVYGEIHILDEQGKELPPREIGRVCFSGGQEFHYRNDPKLTAKARDSQGRSTVGDLGYVDEDGYLYLTDRSSHLIISGGVNIYPQETEDTLLQHPAVLDCAVIGVPNEEFGEEVKAVVQLLAKMSPRDELKNELIDFCRQRIATIKCPRSVDFVDELPRSPTGKLRKNMLREQYRASASSRGTL